MRAWLVSALVVLAACSGNDHPGFGTAPAASPTETRARSTPSGPPPVAGTVAVATSGSSFEPSRVELPRGARVIVAFTNRGGEVHTLVVNELNFHMTADPGETVRLTITVPRARGTFTMFCSIPGHEEKGTAVVR